MKPITPEELEKRKKTNKKILKFFIFPVIILWVIILIIPSDDKVEKNITSKNESEIIINNWEYGESEKDKMDNSSYHYSICSSINKVELKFPYNGGSTLGILLRNGFKKEGNEVILQIDKGQFMSSFDGDKTIKIKFDDNPPIEYTYQNEGTGQSTTIFLSRSKSIIENLKKSKKVIIELDFFDNGFSQFEFNVEGLRWNYK